MSSSASCACPSSNRCLALNDHHKAPRFSSLPIKASKVQAKKHQKALGLRNASKIFKIHISSVSINLHLHLLHVFCTRSSLTTRLLRQNTFAPPAFQKVFTPETLFSKKTMEKTLPCQKPPKVFRARTNSSYTSCQKAFTPAFLILHHKQLDTKTRGLFHQKQQFTRNNSCFSSTVLPQKLLHQRNFTPQAFTPEALSTGNVLQHKPFASKALHTKHPNCFYTRNISITPHAFEPETLFHHKPFYSKNYLGQQLF